MTMTDFSSRIEVNSVCFIVRARIKNWSSLALHDGKTQVRIAKASFYHKEGSARFWPMGSDLEYKNAATIIYRTTYEEIIEKLKHEGANYLERERQRTERSASLRSHSKQGDGAAAQDGDGPDSSSAHKDDAPEL